MLDAALHALDWLIANKKVGVPTAIVLAFAVSALGWWLKRRWGDSKQVAHTGDQSKVQQVNVERVRGNGDVNVAPRQE